MSNALEFYKAAKLLQYKKAVESGERDLLGLVRTC